MFFCVAVVLVWSFGRVVVLVVCCCGRDGTDGAGYVELVMCVLSR